MIGGLDKVLFEAREMQKINPARQTASFIVRCVRCDKPVHMVALIDSLDEYVNGDKSIQECFPDEPADWREMLITGICPECWNKIFGG